MDGIWDSGTEASVVTASNGSFFFSNVTPASIIRIDIVIPAEGTAAAAWAITKPVLGYREVALGPGGAITMQDFGLDNLAKYDWSDLPESFGTTLAANGPRHLVTPGFQLGSSVDGEVNGIPSPLAVGEGLVGDSDDGVVVVSNGGILQRGVNTLRVTVAGVGGLLTAWMDFNANGSFTEAERLIWSLNGVNLGGEADLNPGTWDLQVTIPANAVETAIGALFRWGEPGLSFLGESAIGEVESYFFALNFLMGDYNRNGIVDSADYVTWRKSLGQVVAPFAGADGNGDGIVNDADFDVWRANFGRTLPAPGAGAGAGAGALLAGEDGSSGDAYGGVAAASAAGAGQFTTGLEGASGSSDSTRSGGGTSTSFPSVVGAASNSSSTIGTSVVGSQAFDFAPAVGGTTVVSSIVSFQDATVTASESSGSNLLLLDLAWAGIEDISYDAGDDSLVDAESHEETQVSDLALAAVLNEESDWWDAI
jgi:hypothetical protein